MCNSTWSTKMSSGFLPWKRWECFPSCSQCLWFCVANRDSFWNIYQGHSCFLHHSCAGTCWRSWCRNSWRYWSYVHLRWAWLEKCRTGQFENKSAVLGMNSRIHFLKKLDFYFHPSPKKFRMAHTALEKYCGTVVEHFLNTDAVPGSVPGTSLWKTLQDSGE